MILNPHEPNVNEIIAGQIYWLLNQCSLKGLYPKGTALVARKAGRNFQQLFMRSQVTHTIQKNIVVTLNVLTKIVTTAIILLAKELTMYVILLPCNSKTQLM